MTRICKVLVVEDNFEIRELLGDLFGYEGYRFACVATAEAFRAELAEGDIDVAIIDFVIPGPDDGLGLAKEAADHGSGVILVTGHHDHFASVEQCGHRYLYKPFAIKSLLELVDVTLQETRRKCKVKNRHYG
jgi:two-component system phosphate regulon response regulator OmpR